MTPILFNKVYELYDLKKYTEREKPFWTSEDVVELKKD